MAASLRDYAERINASPERLVEIEDRLAALDRLKRKYGKTAAEVIAFGEDVTRRLGEVEDREGTLKELEAVLAKAATEYKAAAGVLHKDRKAAAAGKLAKLAEEQINSLAMKVKFAVEVKAAEREMGWTASGWDDVTYLIATNPGEPLKPLNEIASGGEMSRVMLALKGCVWRKALPRRRRARIRHRERWCLMRSTLELAGVRPGSGAEAEGAEQGGSRCFA